MTEYAQFKYVEGMSASETKKLVDSKDIDVTKYEARLKSRIYLYDKLNWFGGQTDGLYDS